MLTYGSVFPTDSTLGRLQALATITSRDMIELRVSRRTAHFTRQIVLHSSTHNNLLNCTRLGSTLSVQPQTVSYHTEWPSCGCLSHKTQVDGSSSYNYKTGISTPALWPSQYSTSPHGLSVIGKQQQLSATVQQSPCSMII